MASTTLFQVFLFVILMVSCSCIARTNEIQGLTQGDVGYLASQLILKVFSDLEADIQELKAKVADTQKLKAEITDLKSKYEGGHVSKQPKTIFAQMQLLGTKTYQPGDRVSFTSTVANVGNAYDIQHGYFEAPYHGTYLFIVTLCTTGNNYVEFMIVQDDNNISRVISGDVDWTTCASSTAVTQMKSGSKVWVEINKAYGGGSVNSNYGIPTFTGVLLNNYQNP